MGDAARLKQVLLNLTGNAIKFTEQGRAGISVALVRSAPPAAPLRFSVRDTGIGMDPATRAKLFQVFSQGDSSMTRRFGGGGLGLAISQRLINRMGGHIDVQSRTAEGSKFSFELTLPLVTPPPPAIPVRRCFPRPPSLAGLVLVVADDPVNQRVIELLLQKKGLSCVVVTDGASAVELARMQPWDAILMDCQMQGMDGYEATRQIRRLLAGRFKPIIALTANAMTGDREDCVKCRHGRFSREAGPPRGTPGLPGAQAENARLLIVPARTGTGQPRERN